MQLIKPFIIVVLLCVMYLFVRPKEKQFQFDQDLEVTLPQGHGLTRQHALHFYEVFLNILLNKHNQFAEHAENVYLLNYLIRNDIKWRVTESAIFNMFDITGNNFVNQQEFESFADLFSPEQRQIIDSFRMLIDRNIDTKIMRGEWISFCNKILRPKLIQDLQEWEQNHSALPNPDNITAQYTAIKKEERNRKDLIHLQLDKAIQLFSMGFKQFVKHMEKDNKHTINDQDLFVRKIGIWIVSRFERWDALFNWIYQLLDNDGDGHLSPKECGKQFEIFSVAPTHIRDIFEYFDEDGNGIVTRQEWSDFSETIRRLLFNYFSG